MYMVFPSRKSVQQILCHLKHLINFSFFFFFFHGSSDVIYQKGVQNLYHSNDVDDFKGAKIKTPKNPWTKNLPPKKIPYRTKRPKYAGTTTNLLLNKAV